MDGCFLGHFSPLCMKGCQSYGENIKNYDSRAIMFCRITDVPRNLAVVWFKFCHNNHRASSLSR